MSNETDLDWLAQNVHVWVEDWTHVRKCQVRHEAKWMASLSPNAEYKDWRTKDQWLTRRAELQNKPSWKDAPEWAINLVQIASGSWVWIDSETPKMLFGSGDKFEHSGNYGLVLGDWRDTLERRPADLSEPAVTKRLNEATQDVLAAVPWLKEDKYSFDRNGWFERGELPTVGAVCEVSGEGASPERCKIIAYHKDQVAVQWEAFNGGCLDVLYLLGDFWKFRPIRTDRELAIEEMCRDVNLHVSVFESEAGKLYDAGYRKDPK